MPEIIGVLKGDGWICVACKPSHYCGCVVDFIRHAEVWHQLTRYTADEGAGVVYRGIVEMAVVA